MLGIKEENFSDVVIYRHLFSKRALLNFWRRWRSFILTFSPLLVPFSLLFIFFFLGGDSAFGATPWGPRSH